MLKYLLPVVISAIAFNINRFLESTFYYGTELVSLQHKIRGKRKNKMTVGGKRLTISLGMARSVSSHLAILSLSLLPFTNVK